MASRLSLNSLLFSVMVFISMMGDAFCQDPPTSTESPRGYYDDVPDHDVVGFISVFTVAFSFMCFSLVGMLFVFVRIYVKWRDTERTLSIALRVPLYLGILNFISWGLEVFSFVYPAIYHKPWPGKICTISAGISTAFTLYERFMTALIAITTYLRVCRRIYWNYGRYDWKLWVISGAIALLFTAMGASNFGPDVYWCAIERSSPYVLLVGLGFSIFVLLVCVYCYFRTIMEIRDVVRKASAASASSKISCNNNIRGHRQSTTMHSTADNRGFDIEAKVTRKVMGYILVFLIQWFPIFPYDIYGILNKDAAWAYALVAASFNMGGIGNAICYVMNEGWNLHGNNSTINGAGLGDAEHASSTACSSNDETMGKGNKEDEDFVDV